MGTPAIVTDELDFGETRYTQIPSRPPRDARLELEPGTLFAGRYRIKARVGEGGMGVVYRAHDEQSDQIIALKLLRPELAADTQALERFRREGLLTRRLRHPNIVAFYDIAQADDLAYITMEWLDGKTLRQWMLAHRAHRQAIPFAAARRIIDEILQALIEAHRNGVVHRDLKPENVMLLGEPSKDGFQLRVLDFGIARAMATDSQLTRMGSAMGTALYMAPEQKTGSETVGPEADLYSVSAIFYELLLDIVPEGQWTRPSEARDDVPAWVDDLIQRGLAPPRARIQSAEAYRKALTQGGSEWRTPDLLPLLGTKWGAEKRRTKETPLEPKLVPSPSEGLTDLFRRRIWAGLIDVGIILVLSVFSLEVAGYLVLGVSPSDTLDEVEYQFLLSVFSLPASLGYLVFYWTRKDGRTPGKRLLGLRVVDARGGPLTNKQAWSRALMWLVSINVFLLGFLWMLWDPDHLTWHDRVSQTRVVQIKSPVR